MSDQIEQFSHLNFPNEEKFLDEDNFDQLNDLTFGDEIPWDFDQAQLDDHDAADEGQHKAVFHPLIDHEEKKVTSNLLGLTGSFFNQGLFKFGQKEAPDNYNITDEFELAIKKLELFDDSEVAVSKEDVKTMNTVPDENGVSYESRFEELVKFAQSHHRKFEAIPKVNSNLQYLHHIVLAHVEALHSKARNLRIPVENLNQLSYFKTLKNFLSINTVLANIEAKSANSPIQRHNEITVLFTNFSSQPQQVQSELSAIHPFYANLQMLLATQPHQQQPVSRQHPLPNHSMQSRYPGRQTRYEDVPEWATEEDRRTLTGINARRNTFDEAEGGWMSLSERDWLARLQTRNLSFDNPYVHDYYYTQKKLKEMAVAREHQLRRQGFSSIPDPIMLLPSPVTSDQLGAGVEPYHDKVMLTYKPPQFENSLGILTASNLNTPRQTVQAPPKSELKIRMLASPNRARIELLGLIEKMYCLILRIDELDKSLARVVVTNHRGSILLNTHKNYVVKLLLDSINDSSKFSSLFSVEKGAKVVLSLFAVVPPAKFVQILKLFFYNSLSIFESSHFEKIQDQLRTLFLTRVKVLNKEDISVIVDALFSDMKCSKPLIGFCRTKFGFDVIMGVVEAYLQLYPDAKQTLDRAVCNVIHSMDPGSNWTTACIKQYSELFSGTISIDNPLH